MGFFGALTGSDQADMAQEGYNQANGLLETGRNEARGNINTGYNQGNRALGNAQRTGSTQNNLAVNALEQGRDSAISYLDPYTQSGSQANTMYGNALGLNGADAQQAFGQNYAASDPFRAQNANFANEGLMQVLNARGLSGSGYAASAVADQSLRRGSEDYGNYLNRLQGQSQQGLQAAGQAGNAWQNWGNARAGQANSYTGNNNQVAGMRNENAVGRGNALSTLNYGYGQQLAGNAIGNASAQSAASSTGVNNLIALGGLAVSAYTGVPVRPPTRPPTGGAQ